MIFILLVALLLLIRSEWGQNIIVNKATSYVSDKTGTRVEIERLFISFDGDIVVEELFLDTPSGDTLIYSEYIEADMPLWPIIKGEGMGIEELDSRGLKATISRKDTINGFNFQFLLDAFASDQTVQEAVPDNSSKSSNLILGDINVTHADVVYNDNVNGIESHFIVGTLRLNMEKTDIDNMRFSAYEGFLENTTIAYKQLPIPEESNDEETDLPVFEIASFVGKNVTGSYDQVESNMLVEFRVPNIQAQIPNINLNENRFDFHKLSLTNGFIGVNINENVLIEDSIGVSEDLWPEIIMTAAAVDISNTSINYTINNARAQSEVFNPDALFFRNIQVIAQDFYLKDREVGVVINTMNGVESSGLHVKRLSGTYKMDDRQMSGESINLLINQNQLVGRFNANYTSLENLIASPEDTKISSRLSSIILDLSDVYRFEPSLYTNEYINTLSKNLIKGSLNVEGSLAELGINNLNLGWSGTRIVGNGVVTNSNNPDLLAVIFPNYSVSTTRTDLTRFVNEDELGVRLPDQFLLSGSLRGNSSAITTNSILKSSQGTASLEGDFEIGEPISFNADFAVNQYDLGNLLQNEKLGNITGNISAQGNGKTINTLDAIVDVTIDTLFYNDYKIQDLPINGTIKNGKGSLISSYKDQNLNIKLSSNVKLDSIAPEIRASINIIGADLRALGLMKRDVRTGAEIEAFFKGNATSYNASAIINDGVIVYDNTTYLLGNLETRARIRPDTTTVSLKNKIVDINLESNTDPAGFATAIQDHIYSYFYRDAIIVDTLSKPVNLKVRGKIAQAPLLNEVFLVNVKDLDTINLMVDFDQTQRKLDASINAPHVNYSGNEIDSLSFVINTSEKRFDFDLGFNAIKAGPIAIGRTDIKGRQENNELKLDFLAYDGDEKLIHMNAGITGTSERLRFHVNEDEVIFNRKLWTTPATNEVIITQQNLDFNDFRFKRNSQEVNFSSDLPDISKNHASIEFINFKLQEFLSYLNPDEQLAEGNLNGNFIVEDPYGSIGFLADLKITDLGLMNVQMGTLNLDAKALGGNEYDFTMDLSGGAATLELIGDYTARETEAIFNMDLAINKFEMQALEGLSQGALTNGSGNLAGNFTIAGTLSEPEYEGELRFNEAGFKIAAFNTAFTLPQETIDINNSGLSMDNFRIVDENDNTLIANGTIGTDSFLNPNFDITLDAQNFQALNATKDDNDLIYGKAVITATAKIKGDLEIPIVELEGTVNSETDITYVMPASTANIESSEGIVIFVNRENPDAILTRNEEEAAVITGFDIESLIKVVDGARVKIILDESTGDNVQVTGKGEFVFTMLPNGRMSLTGGYEMSDGQYSMNLYNLVNRTFDIAPGSRISWSGDPFNANLDVRAIYRLETSASSLMAPTSSGADPVEQGRYRQVLPFLVYLNVDGELMAPKLTFGLDMPEDDQGAIGGQVYGRVQQVNTQEGELNRQVFSLLVLNRFYPDPGSDGSRGGFANIARDNLNDALSDQLNVFSDKLLGKTGVELNFGLDSYTDYQGETPQERTQLDIAAQKKLFDDRLIVTVGSAVDVQGENPSGETTPIVGNVSLEYVLTNDGRYRIKGFRRNEFENVIDGQTIASGIGLIFTQEFNKFSELWEAILRSKTKQLKEKEKERETENEKLKDANPSTDQSRTDDTNE